MLKAKQQVSIQERTDIYEQIVQERRAMRVFDTDAPFDSDAVKRSLQRAVLSPNSSNLQTWEFHRIISPEAKKHVSYLCMNQSAARTANELLVVAVRSDKGIERADWALEQIRPSFSNPMTKKDKRAVEYYKRNIPLLYNTDPFGFWTLVRKCIMLVMGRKRPFVRFKDEADVRIMGNKSAALAAQTFMLSMQAEGYATCPMEGFDSKRMRKYLGLPKRTDICMVIGVGVGTEEGVYSKRVRLPFEEVVFER